MTSPTTNNNPPVFLASPFPHPDLSQVISQPFTLQDIGNCALVSKAWSKAMNSLGVWSMVYDYEKIPQIPSRADTAKENFLFMRKITLSKSQAAPLAAIVGKVPPISEKTFEFLKYGKDCFEPSKYNDETHVVIVEPTHFIIPYDANFADHFYDWFDADTATLGGLIPKDAEYRVPGHDIEIDDAKTEMKIPYSWFSVMKLAQRSWTKTAPLFEEYIDDSVSRIFKGTIKFSEAVNVYIMRINPPEIVKDRKYSIQKQIMQSKGYEVAPFTPRMYFNLIELFNKEKCPDGKLSMRTSDRIEFVHEDLSRELGTKIFEYGNASIGDANASQQSAFPRIGTLDESRDTENVSAPAGFPAELEGFKQMPGGIKRTHDEAFGQ